MKKLSCYLIVLLGFIALSNQLWSDGMFLDGVYYASISKNLSNGLGSFWFLPSIASSDVFHGHPPLAMGLQSILFSIFGDSIYIERAYSLFTFLITGFFIHLIWKEVVLGKYSSYSWVVLFFWAIIPLNGWACSNNFLENTMNIFVSSAVLFAIKNIKTNQLAYILISGISLSLAFLSKGFTGLFPLSIFFWYFLVFSSMKFNEMISKTLLLFIFSLLPFLLLYIFHSSAIDSLSNYINVQVIGSLKNVQTTDNRLGILYELANQMKIFNFLSIISIYIYISVLLLRRFKLINFIENHIKHFFVLSFIFLLPSSLLEIFTYSLTRYHILNAFLHLSFFILIAHLVLKLLFEKRLITRKRRNELLSIFSIIISLVILKIWSGNGIYFMKLVLSRFPLIFGFLLISGTYICYKNYRRIHVSKENIGLVFIAILLCLLYLILSHHLLAYYIRYLFWVVLVYISIQTFNKIKLFSSTNESRWILFFMLLGFSGVIPMMISLKQGGFYILTALPYFTISFAILIFPILYYIVNRLRFKRKIVYLFMVVLCILLGPFISYSSVIRIPYIGYWKVTSLKYQYERIGRDIALLDDIRLIMSELPEGAKLNIDFQKHYIIHAYFARHVNISLDVDNRYKYLISFEDGWSYDGRIAEYVEESTSFQRKRQIYKKDYKKIDINTDKLHLYKYYKE